MSSSGDFVAAIKDILNGDFFGEVFSFFPAPVLMFFCGSMIVLVSIAIKRIFF